MHSSADMLKGNEIARYLERFEHRAVNLLWRGGEMEFPFLNVPHVRFCEAMGFESRQVTPALREVVPGALPDRAALDALTARQYFDPELIKAELKKLEKMKKRPGLHGGGSFGPLTVASDILGCDRMLRLTVKEPSLVEDLAAYAAECIIRLAEEEAAHGAEFFWVAEPCASLLAPESFTRFSGNHLRRIFESCGVPGFLHVCGKTLRHTPYMEQTGAQVISIDSLTDIGDCIRMLSPDTVLMGNVDVIDRKSTRLNSSHT